ncbi:MAG: ATP-binding cassette domain-containing protein [SAR324 cluster bacterium]|nr:ATP-binding cassette domain-containing protein [SAR324 cluster bacterium]
MSTLSLHGVSRVVAGHTILNDVTLKFPEGRISLLLGPNGAGKTTLLRLCALLDAPSGGELRLEPQGESTPSPARDGITMVFQRPGLFDRTVWDNLAYPLKVRGLAREECEARIREGMAVADLEALSGRQARSLSGGEAQRLALARAFVTRPAVLLLDEPVANLDPASRWRIEEMVLQMQDRFGTTVVLTTHDLLQARKIGDTVFFINRGRVSGGYETRGFFQSPPNEEVMRFISGVLHQELG